MNKKEQKKIDDFMASCREDDDGGEEYEQKPKVELDPARGRMSKPYVESCGSFCDNLDGIN